MRVLILHLSRGSSAPLVPPVVRSPLVPPYPLDRSRCKRRPSRSGSRKADDEAPLRSDGCAAVLGALTATRIPRASLAADLARSLGAGRERRGVGIRPGQSGRSRRPGRAGAGGRRLPQHAGVSGTRRRDAATLPVHRAADRAGQIGASAKRFTLEARSPTRPGDALRRPAYFERSHRHHPAPARTQSGRRHGLGACRIRTGQGPRTSPLAPRLAHPTPCRAALQAERYAQQIRIPVSPRRTRRSPVSRSPRRAW